MSIIKIMLKGLLVIIIAIPAWMLCGIVMTAWMGSYDSPMNNIALLPCLIVSFLFAWKAKTGSIKQALLQGIIWALMLACIVIPLSISGGGMNWVLVHPEIYLMPISILLGPLIYYWFNSWRKSKRQSKI
jgi:ABC-type Mn2+/Zn2+ transport system permease subunit